MDSGREQNYWPGFVDALSNVVLTLVFVLVIFVFALVIASNKVEQQMQEVTQAATAVKNGQGSQNENAVLKQQLAAATTELQKLRSENAMSDRDKNGAVNRQAVASQNEEREIAIDTKTVDPENKGPVGVVHQQNSVSLKFPVAVAQMDQKSEDQLGHVLEALQKIVGNHKIIMRSYIGLETYSVAERMAYYRAINARNYLINKAGEAPSNISISILNPPQPADGHVEIILEKN